MVRVDVGILNAGNHVTDALVGIMVVWSEFRLRGLKQAIIYLSGYYAMFDSLLSYPFVEYS